MCFSQFPLNVSVLHDNGAFMNEEEINIGAILLTADFTEISLVQN